MQTKRQSDYLIETPDSMPFILGPHFVMECPNPLVYHYFDRFPMPKYASAREILERRTTTSVTDGRHGPVVGIWPSATFLKNWKITAAVVSTM